jgi:hypothetical protein
MLVGRDRLETTARDLVARILPGQRSKETGR